MNKLKLFTLFFFTFTSAYSFALGSKDVTPGNESAYIVPTQSTTSSAAPVSQATRPEQVMKALAEAYPKQIDRVEFRNGDWAVLLRGAWYYYAEGRLLPENLLTRAETFSTHGFYNYRIELPEWSTPSAEEQERYRAASAARNQTQIRRSPLFFDNLWRSRNSNESYERVKSMRFLGKPVTVHFMIMEQLSLVERSI